MVIGLQPQKIGLKARGFSFCMSISGILAISDIGTMFLVGSCPRLTEQDIPSWRTKSFKPRVFRDKVLENNINVTPVYPWIIG